MNFKEENNLKNQSNSTTTKKLGIAEILYYVGGAIVFLGIAILVSQNWSVLNTFTKIALTLGLAVGAYIIGVFLDRNKDLFSMAQAFYLISGTLLPIGLWVVFNSIGFDTKGSGVQSLISGIPFAVYLFSFIIFRKNIFAVFGIMFGTWLFFAFSNFLVGNKPLFNKSKFFEYRLLLVGLVYILLAYSLSKKQEKHPLVSPLYGFGVFGLLGSALTLGGWQPNQNVFWEIIYPGLTLGVIFLGAYLKIKSFLTFGSIFLMLYILKITGEYFANSLGWPISLVIAGFSLIVIGYLSFYLNKKYLSSQ